MNNRKARLLLDVPSKLHGNKGHEIRCFNISNHKRKLVYGDYVYGNRRKLTAAQKRSWMLFEKQRAEDMARWRAAGVFVEESGYTGRR